MLSQSFALVHQCVKSPLFRIHVSADCRKIEQRQIGERCRVAGNGLFQAGHWAEAYQEYDRGVSADKHNMALHANAALCSLKMACNVQAIEHADKVVLTCTDSGNKDGMASLTSCLHFEHDKVASTGMPAPLRMPLTGEMSFDCKGVQKRALRAFQTSTATPGHVQLFFSCPALIWRGEHNDRPHPLLNAQSCAGQSVPYMQAASTKSILSRHISKMLKT